jgi:alkanesulfonate monooxygenase SsuD/methylene tetrahydromethanopterin reductase-like flavin-dependent oxidoreductase (luciferase family)
LRDRGVFAALEPPDDAGAYEYTEAERVRLVQLRQSAFVGDAAQVADKINRLAREVGAAEVAVVTWAYEEEVRVESYRLLAKAMGLPASS